MLLLNSPKTRKLLFFLLFFGRARTAVLKYDIKILWLCLQRLIYTFLGSWREKSPQRASKIPSTFSSVSSNTLDPIFNSSKNVSADDKKMWSKSVKDLTFCNQMRNVPCYCQNVQSALSLFITELPNCIKGDVAFEDCLLPLIMNKMFLQWASKCSFDDRKQKEIWEKSTNHQQNVAERLEVIRKSINGETTRRLGCRCYF